MADDPQRRFEADLALDPVVRSAAREGLTGTSRGDMYQPDRDPEDVTVPPDGRPMEEQPQWRQDFSIDWPRDHYIARRDFVGFLVLTSGAFVAGQGWIAAQSLIRRRRLAPERRRIVSLADVPLGSAIMFDYPGEHDPCLLIRTRDDQLVAYSQKCTHLSCAVVPRLDEGVLHCPCHEGFFDLMTGRNIAGPPPRPLPSIQLEIERGEIYAVGLVTRTV